MVLGNENKTPSLTVRVHVRPPTKRAGGGNFQPPLVMPLHSSILITTYLFAAFLLQMLGCRLLSIIFSIWQITSWVVTFLWGCAPPIHSISDASAQKQDLQDANCMAKCKCHPGMQQVEGKWGNYPPSLVR